MTKKILHVFIVAVILASVCIATMAKDADYKEIYQNYAMDADVNYNNVLNRNLSGLMMLDLNADKVPELLAYETTVMCYDQNGKKIGHTDAGYENPAFKTYEHRIARAFSIIDGEVIEDSPWYHGSSFEPVVMSLFPNEDVVDTEEFSHLFWNEGKNKFVMYSVSDRGSFFSIIWYENGRFNYSVEDFDYDLFGFHAYESFPIAHVGFRDEKGGKRTYSQTMELLLDNYEASASACVGYEKMERFFHASDWAIQEINEAEQYGLIPKEMMDDNLTENITRAEFSAIAINLYQAIKGETLNWHGGYICDIDENEYQMYIRGAYVFGITNGTQILPNGCAVFSPDLHITREQMASMLLRVVKLNKFEDWSLERDGEFPLPIKKVNKFNDDAQISAYANEAVYYLSKHGIIKGVDNKYFAPQNVATKEQAIMLSLRIYQAFANLPVTE